MFNFLDESTLIYRVPALLIAMALHEYAHAYVSDSLGDPTPKAQGRLTANPLKHIDPLGLIMLAICGFGWAKPVQIDPAYYKNFKSGVIKVSFAGPGMNLLICFLAECIMLVMTRTGFLFPGQPGYYFLYWMMLYNVWFAFFNLIPVPPLDGSKIAEMLLPGKWAWHYHNISYRYSFILLMVLVFSGAVGKIIGPLSVIYTGTVMKIIDTVLGIF